MLIPIKKQIPFGSNLQCPYKKKKLYVKNRNKNKINTPFNNTLLYWSNRWVEWLLWGWYQAFHFHAKEILCMTHIFCLSIILSQALHTDKYSHLLILLYYWSPSSSSKYKEKTQPKKKKNSCFPIFPNGTTRSVRGMLICMYVFK